MSSSTSRETFAGSTYPTRSTVASFVPRVAGGKRVTGMAVRLPSISCRTSDTSEYVCSYRHGLKMVGVDANSIAAQVINLQPLRYLPFMQLVREPVNKLNLSPRNRDLPVTAGASYACPLPATRPNVYPPPESIRERTTTFWTATARRAPVLEKTGIVSLTQPTNSWSVPTTNNATLHSRSIAYGVATWQ